MSVSRARISQMCDASILVLEKKGGKRFIALDSADAHLERRSIVAETGSNLLAIET